MPLEINGEILIHSSGFWTGCTSSFKAFALFFEPLKPSWWLYSSFCSTWRGKVMKKHSFIPITVINRYSQLMVSINETCMHLLVAMQPLHSGKGFIWKRVGSSWEDAGNGAQETWGLILAQSWLAMSVQTAYFTSYLSTPCLSYFLSYLCYCSIYCWSLPGTLGVTAGHYWVELSSALMLTFPSCNFEGVLVLSRSQHPKSESVMGLRVQVHIGSHDRERTLDVHHRKSLQSGVKLPLRKSGVTTCGCKLHQRPDCVSTALGRLEVKQPCAHLQEGSPVAGHLL